MKTRLIPSIYSALSYKSWSHVNDKWRPELLLTGDIHDRNLEAPNKHGLEIFVYFFFLEFFTDEPEDAYLLTWFDLVNQKNLLLRRENELIYM